MPTVNFWFFMKGKFATDKVHVNSVLEIVFHNECVTDLVGKICIMKEKLKGFAIKTNKKLI